MILGEENMRVCDRCGTRLRDDAKFCDSCGKSITSKKEVNSVTEELKKKEIQEIKIRNILIIVGIIIAIIIVGYLIWINTDAKTVLVNGGNWSYVGEDYSGDTELKTYTFFDDGTYKYTLQGDVCEHRSTGRYKIKNDRLYLEEEKDQVRCSIYRGWSDTDTLSSWEFNLEIKSADTIVISLDEYTSHDDTWIYLG